MKRILLVVYLAILAIALFFNHSLGQTWDRELYFRNISTDDGLSSPTINSIYRDSRGYIWIGTVDGLNRYDGYEFKVYLPDPKNSNSISSNRIFKLFEDADSSLWLGTSNGLCEYNYKSERFTTHKSDDGFDQIFDFSHDKKNNRVWIVTSQGLQYLDLTSGVIENFNNDTLNSKVPFRLLIIDHDLYIGTSKNGVYKLDIISFKVSEFCNEDSGEFQILNNWVSALHFYEDQLFIATEKGLVKYSLEHKRPTYYTTENSQIPSNNIATISNDSYGNIFFGTDKGLAILNQHTNLISFYSEVEGNFTSLSSNLIRTVFVDTNDDLWVGTIQRGIDHVNRASRNMTLVKKKFISENSLSDNNVSCFAQDAKGGMWIGTQENGLNYYKDGIYTYFTADGSEHSLSSNKVKNICIDENEVVWFSTYGGGLNSYKNGLFEHYMKDESNPNTIQSNKVRNIDLGKNGIIWLATENGLESFDMKGENFSHHYLRNENKLGQKRKNIRIVLEGSDGNVYAGTNTGLYIYNPFSKKTEHYQANIDDSTALQHNVIVEIFEDSHNQIWLGSPGGGLIKFDKESKTFKSYITLNGFPDNSIKSIEEDEKGNLWIGTNKGIVKFSPSTEEVVVYGKSYGLQGNAFNIDASYRCNDGRLIFGGPDGFNVFNPEDLEAKKDQLNVIITDLRLFDESVKVSEESSVLTEDISLIEHVSLSYGKSKHFSLYFSALQFSNPDQVQYAYRLKGFNDGWHYIGKEHYVSFTNLEPNNYVFEVMASDNGQWNNSVKKLDIIITPPIYMRAWFRISLLIFVVLLIVSFYYYKRYNFKKAQIILEKLVVEKNKEIRTQNEELQAINEELVSQNEEVVKQKDYIDNQNIQLTQVQDELKIVNLSLEEKINIRTEELEESNKTLDKAVKELDRFVYSASHDLSAPLKSILGLVNIAKLEDKGGNLQVHLNYIEESIRKQENVIKSLIQYSRNSRQEIKKEAVNLCDLVNQIIKDLKYIPGSIHIKMINNLEKNEVVLTDEQRIKMVLNNLLSNGVKYRGIDRGGSFVKVQCIKNSNSWQLTVEDNGQGIAEDQQEKIFEMFHRANEDSEGSGLGLFIVKEAVEKLDGTIIVESAINEGSVFKLEFPN